MVRVWGEVRVRVEVGCAEQTSEPILAIFMDVLSLLIVIDDSFQRFGVRELGVRG